MKILKNYEKFLENKNTKLDNGAHEVINEGKVGDFFRKAGNKI